MSKKILITGINGFIGSNAKKYFAESFEIFGLDIFGEAEKNFRKHLSYLDMTR